MALFFKRDFAKQFDENTVLLRKLQETIRESVSKVQEKDQISRLLKTADTDIDTIIGQYRCCLLNSQSDFKKQQLINEYEKLIECMTKITTDPNYDPAECLKDMRTESKAMSSLEVLTRLWNALAAVFWLGVATISLVAAALSIATVPADPVGGVAGTMISAGLFCYSVSAYVENVIEIFETKEYFINTIERNNVKMPLIEGLNTAYHDETLAPRAVM